ncbi:hypothetical protein ACFQ6C_26700 [Streptomyces sp. NPDC056454]|uniref:hypothetical protein n=1 Tax=Streptomyces sp. NPDC056454 TaxID=3345823 RepID=UPI0036B127A9
MSTVKLPRFIKTYTGGYRSYRFQHNGQTYEVFRFRSNLLGWCVDRIDGMEQKRVISGEDTRRAAVLEIIEKKPRGSK